MGFRNPFRMSVDKATGTVYLGDYGPDSGTAKPDRGPEGQVEFNRITKAGNYGWPYCTGKNDAYTDYNFATGTPGTTFDCSAPKNTSPHNTGLTDLPPAQPSWIPYTGTSVPEFGGGSESPMGGPVYRYDAGSTSEVKFPQEFDGDFFAGEFGRRWIKRIEAAGDGTVQSINPFPLERHPGDGHGFRPGRRSLRPRLRHRLLQRRRKLRPVPHRTRHRRPRPDRAGQGERHLRQGTSDRLLLLGRQFGPGRRRPRLLVGLRRRRDLHRRQYLPHLLGQRPVHGHTEGHGHHRQDRYGVRADHRREHRPHSEDRPTCGRTHLRLRRRDPVRSDGDRP
ncbi:hypothetical protein SHIRM173S_10062 [Streptomyces hirsutus]